MVRLYVKLSKINLKPFNGQIFNCGFENFSILKYRKVKKIVERKTKNFYQVKILGHLKIAEKVMQLKKL